MCVCVCVFTESGDVQSLRSETCTSLRSPIKPLYNPHTLQSAPLPHYPSFCFQCFIQFWLLSGLPYNCFLSCIPSIPTFSFTEFFPIFSLYSFPPFPHSVLHFFLVERIKAAQNLVCMVCCQPTSEGRSSNSAYFLTCYT